jgi:hypothetical protein
MRPLVNLSRRIASNSDLDERATFELALIVFCQYLSL